MCDVRWRVSALCRPLPDCMRILLFSRTISSLFLLASLSLSVQAQTYTLTVSPTNSTDGSYTVTWSKPASSSIRTRP